MNLVKILPAAGMHYSFDLAVLVQFDFVAEACSIHLSHRRSVTGNSIMDHLTYMGVNMEADSSDSCGIVFYNDETLHCHEDLAGNFVLSK